jgi:shikimate kinase
LDGSGAASPLPCRIALIGFMGSGKTTTGHALAEHLGYAFVDTDDLILQSAASHRTIPEIFASEGEERFREREASAVRAACTLESVVIATGGGAVLRSANASVLKDTSFVVWLTARPEVVVSRTQHDAESRPLLAAAAAATAAGDTGALYAQVLSLIAARGPHYQAVAHCIVDTSDRPPKAVAEEIARKAMRDSRGQTNTRKIETL